ncbi:hypothetical protein [Halorubrum sp. HHNYT27]|uniref:hypothetical protein n=1 Tax=Halorubrum sp. HHNYT27 TaxID=3402275 RepID=UPI003EC0C8B9
MTDRNSSRSKQLIGLGQICVTSFIREAVREAVREALVEERASADEQGEHTQRSVTEDRTESGNRILGPAMLLPILGLAVVGVIVRRRGLPTGLTGERGADEDDGTPLTFDSTQQSTADSD